MQLGLVAGCAIIETRVRVANTIADGFRGRDIFSLRVEHFSLLSISINCFILYTVQRICAVDHQRNRTSSKIRRTTQKRLTASGSAYSDAVLFIPRRLDDFFFP